MAARYIPQSDARLALWLENFEKSIKASGKELGFTDAEIKDAGDRAVAVAAAIVADEQKRAEWQAAVARTAALKETTLPVLQRVIDRASTSAAWSEEKARVFMAVAPKPQAVRFDGDFKPAFKLSVEGGRVRVLWIKGDLDAVRIERRHAGEQGWKQIGIDMRPPFDDYDPLKQPGVPEAREYRLIGVVNDEDVGAPSDIVSVLVSA